MEILDRLEARPILQKFNARKWRQRKEVGRRAVARNTVRDATL